MCKHKIRFIRQSLVYYKGKYIDIDVWQCDDCKGYYIINNRTGAKISLDGLIGEEI